MKKLMFIIGVVLIGATVAQAADIILEWYDGDGRANTRTPGPDGGGGFVLDGTSQDALGAWGSSAYRFLTGDFDGDGADEVAIQNISDGRLYARELVSDGSGGLMIDMMAQYSLGTWGNSAYVGMFADIDGDGTDEYLLHRPSDYNLDVREVISDGSGGFVLDATSQDALGAYGNSAYRFLTGDIDGDGTDEVAIHSLSTGALYVRELVSDGSGGLKIDMTAQYSLGAWGSSAYTSLFADIDGDGTDEFLLYRSSDGNLQSREVISDGSGGYVLDTTSTDDLGNWGSAAWTPMALKVPLPPSGTLIIIK